MVHKQRLPRQALTPRLLAALDALRRDEIAPEDRPLVEEARWTADWVLELDSDAVLAAGPDPGLAALLEREVLPWIDPAVAADPAFAELVATLLERDGLTGAAHWFRNVSLLET